MIEDKSKILPVLIEEEMKKSYIDYSMSVIVSRALPDIRDGMKPVHRRVLYGMSELGLTPNSAYKKSARIVGEVLGKYHPHGDSAVYDTMVRLAQNFSMRYPLVDGQGNFGSVDGDSAAAMRYTEARLTPIAVEVLRDIEKNTVSFVPNFDETLKEPSVLPALLPNLLVNGASGIAVGMATNIPPHNLGEVVDAINALISRPSIKPESLLKYLKGPDFPTGGMVTDNKEIKEYFTTGRGKLTVRARAHIEDMRAGRKRIVVTELPYQVNKAALQEKIAGFVRDKKIEGITEIRDESDREGMRVVFELRKDISAETVLKKLYQRSQMQTTFGVIMLALVDGQPKLLNMKAALSHFIDFRHDIVLRRTQFELDKAERRAHILEGYIIALDNIDKVVELIKKSRSVSSARKNLMSEFKLTEIQAQAILEMRLQRLTGLERKKIQDEYRELLKTIERLKALLANKSLRMQLIKDELNEIKEKYSDSRRTLLISSGKSKKTDLKDLIQEDRQIVTVSHSGIIKRFNPDDYENDNSLIRFSGKDFTEFTCLTANSHYLLFITSLGLCHPLRVSFVPPMTNGNEGASIVKLLQLKKNEKIVSIFELGSFNQNQFLTLASAQGQIKRLKLESLSVARDGGITIMTLKQNDYLIGAQLTHGTQDIIMTTRMGMCVRFSEQDVRDMGLAAAGVRGITLVSSDRVISLIALDKKNGKLLTVTNLGYGKRSDLSEYRTIKRGGKGIITYKLSDKVGFLAAALEVQNQDTVLFITKKGKVKRQRAKGIKEMGRATQGEAIVNISQTDEIIRAILKPEDKFQKEK